VTSGLSSPLIGYPRYTQLHDPEWLLANSSRLTRDIVREIGCTRAAVSWAFRTAGIERNVRRAPRGPRHPQLSDSEFVAGKSVSELMAAAGASSTTVYGALRALNGPARAFKYPLLHDAAWQQRNAHRSWVDIATEIGCHPVTVGVVFRKAGYQRPDGGYRYPQLHDPAWLAGKTVTEVAAITGARRATVEQAFRDQHVVRAVSQRPGPLPGTKPPRYPQLADGEWLRAHLHLAVDDVAALVGCSVAGVAIAYRRHGIVRRKPSRLTPELVADLAARYEAGGYTLRQLAVQAGVSPSTLGRALNR